MIGSGRYTVAEYEPGQQTVLEANPEYTGDDPAQIDRVIIQYYDKSSTLKQAVEQGEVDVAYRSLSPTDIDDLEGADGVEVVDGRRVREIRYLNFNLDLQEGTRRAEAGGPPGRGPADRPRSRSPRTSTTAPRRRCTRWCRRACSSTPRRSPTSTARSPIVDAATQTLEDAGVDTPVPLEVWWTPTHYGPASGDEYAEIKRQLDESGLFDVTLESTEWNQYSEAAFTDKYPVYQLGWFPDYPDADNYTSPFYSKDSFLNIHYENPEMEKLLAEEKASTDDADARGGVRRRSRRSAPRTRRRSRTSS